MSNKLIVVVGITGNQGGSVAETFLTHPDWKIRGITRDISKPAAQHWTTRGVEMVAADLDNPSSLTSAFTGATAIFGTTDFVTLFSAPETLAAAQARGITPNEIGEERERTQAINLVDAAATALPTLQRFVLSTLSDTKGWSKGKITFNLHFDGKWAAVQHLKSKHAGLWAKTSLLQIGLYASNWKQGANVPRKVGEGVYKVGLPMSGDAKFPMMDVNRDTGPLTQALTLVPPGKNLMGAGALLSWNEWCAIWSRVHGVTCTFEQQDRKVLEDAMPYFGRELADMFQYIDEFGYDGGDPTTIYPWDLDVAGGVKVTGMEEYIRSEDWSAVLQG
ncbi:hypothetical protein BDV95DRAFT_313939 [Massariosphaeria phaeospora]|uniref:NmrA-like domain-containing protein n=1 Tax=Massariosphaeria phaeospora TaxID=100035 RepID=A0A7C8MUI9_9PLEO|nr:hypothetical protein BDV95DRAFT_313939 [Massariosphaeria phaeospora]